MTSGNARVSGPVHAARWTAPALAVLACTAAAVLLTRGQEPGVAALGVPAGQVAGTSGGLPAGPLAGPLAGMLPTDAEWGTGWVRDDRASWQQIADGDGLLHPCGVRYASDVQRLQLVRRNVVQDEMVVPVGSAMTFELARYRPGGAQQALTERVDGLRGCTAYTRTFAGLPNTPVDVGLLPPPAGGGAAAHLTATADTSVGRQAVEYTVLVARQGDLLLTALVGNGNGYGPDLDRSARGYFQTAQQKLAGLPHPSPEQQ